MPTATDAELLDLLTRGRIEPLGRIVDSSNGALLCDVVTPEHTIRAIHKPIRFERPLWDYPDGTLADRERAAYLISAAAGFTAVPPTVVRDGPFGPGSLQVWVGDLSGARGDVVDVGPKEQVPPEWLTVLEGVDETGRAVVVSHSADEALRSVAVLDVLLNNSDRKGGHLFVVDDHLWACDHGVSLGVDPKLRTVLWGWIGRPVPPADLARVQQLLEALDTGLADELALHLTADEVRALRERSARLISEGRHPAPTPGWPAIPWPAL